MKKGRFPKKWWIGIIIVVVVIVCFLIPSNDNKVKEASGIIEAEEKENKKIKDEAISFAEAYVYEKLVSKEKLREVLIEEGYSNDIADYVVENCSIKWESIAEGVALEHLEKNARSYYYMLDYLISKGFEEKIAEKALNDIDIDWDVSNHKDESKSKEERKNEEDSKSEEESKNKEDSERYTINDIDVIFFKNVKNDKTKKWRLAVISDDSDLNDYVIDFYKKFISDKSDIFGIVNTKKSIVANVSNITDDWLDISVTEYQDGEENDASLLFGGKELEHYWINSETGEIDDLSNDSNNRSDDDSDDDSGNITASMLRALDSAKNYLECSAFSKKGIKEQLEYEGFSEEEADYAAEHCNADWKEQAVEKAKSYIDFSAFSYTGLIEQLEYEGFTNEEATYGTDNCNADWKEQAAKKAESYMDYSSMSKEELKGQLEYEGFTDEQINYAIGQIEW